MKKLSFVAIALVIGGAAAFASQSNFEDTYRLLRAPFTEGTAAELEPSCPGEDVDCAENITNPSAPALKWTPTPSKH